MSWEETISTIWLKIFHLLMIKLVPKLFEVRFDNNEVLFLQCYTLSAHADAFNTITLSPPRIRGNSEHLIFSKYHRWMLPNPICVLSASQIGTKILREEKEEGERGHEQYILPNKFLPRELTWL